VATPRNLGEIFFNHQGGAAVQYGSGLHVFGGAFLPCLYFSYVYHCFSRFTWVTCIYIWCMSFVHVCSRCCRPLKGKNNLRMLHLRCQRWASKLVDRSKTSRSHWPSLNFWSRSTVKRLGDRLTVYADLSMTTIGVPLGPKMQSQIKLYL